MSDLITVVSKSIDQVEDLFKVVDKSDLYKNLIESAKKLHTSDCNLNFL